MLFFFASKDVAVITHGFQKTSARVSEAEIERAKKYRHLYLKNPDKHTYAEEHENDC